MSLITRCPACRTMFKVVPDQLRISEGWVRCGKCEEIFNASSYLVQAEVQASAVAASDAPDTVPFEGALAAALASEVPVRPVQQAGAGAEPAAQDRFPLAQGDVDFELKELRGADVAPMVEPAVPSSPLPAEDSTQGGHTPAGFGAATDTLPDEESAARVEAATPVELSFMRSARKASRWHRPLVRATLMVACLLLTAGLALQVLVQERDRVAALEPRVKPWLDNMCLLLDCQVRPLRQIESVVIDSSAFSKTKGDVYRLSLTLKNTAPIDLATPAVELALTDTMDRAVIRRVFRPDELGLRAGVIAAASEAQTTLELTIKTNGTSERVAGYRLLAFYP